MKGLQTFLGMSMWGLFALGGVVSIFNDAMGGGIALVAGLCLVGAIFSDD